MQVLQFNCVKCGKLVTPKKNKLTRANKNGKCTHSCDGIQRDGGGFPLDPILREKFKAGLKEWRNEKKLLTPKLQTLSDIKQVSPQTDIFHSDMQWRILRYRVLATYGRKCMCCGTISGEMHVDHIKPRSKYPNLALDFNNLQVLCRECNFGKSNFDETDWRPKLEN